MCVRVWGRCVSVRARECVCVRVGGGEDPPLFRSNLDALRASRQSRLEHPLAASTLIYWSWAAFGGMMHVKSNYGAAMAMA